MKNLKIFALSAISLFGFAACQQVEIAPDVTPEATHTVTFVAGAPETKTTVDISDGETAKFAWTEKDVEENRISVYENDNAASTVVCGLDDKGKMTIMAAFDGSTAPKNASYVAVVNKSNATQIMSAAAYDEEADILVSKAVSSFDGENGVLLQFKREVAIAKMTLKGLDAGEVVNIVTVSSTADIAGSYGVEGWASSAKTSLDISSALYINDEGYSIVANESGEAVVWFTCIPQDKATLTVKVVAADGDTYTKTFSRAITLTRGDVKAFGVKMVKDVPKTYGYQKIEKVGDYTPGDYIIVAHAYKDDCPTKGDFAIANNLTLSPDKLVGADVTNLIDNNVISESNGASYKLSLSGDIDNIVISNGTNILAYSSGTNLVLDGENKYWTLSLNEGTGGTFKLLNNSTATEKTKRALLFQSYSTSGNNKTESLKFGAYAASNINSADYAAIELYKYQEVAPSTPKYSISFAEVTGGTLSATPSKAESGAEVTLTATPEEGYKFNDDWTVKYADEGTVSVTEGKFTMPAANVTVSGTFSKKDYRITKTASEHGSIVAKKGDAEVETAQMGDEITLFATQNEGFEFTSWEVVDSKGTVIEVKDNKFTMPASNVTITATFRSNASYTVSFSVNGNVTTGSYKESEKIEFPADPEISGVTFMGWITNAIEGTQAEAPVFVETASAVMGTENITYYAVFATQGTEIVSEKVGQTLAYDTWTYNGSTTDKSSYRLFHSDSYIESAEFDLSTLTKVVVYGGTFGGDSYKKLTIGDGTNTWKAVTVSGSNQTGVNTYTDGTPLTGTGKLRITSNSGTASSTGVRISKVVIYVGVYGYTDYCTKVVTLSSVTVSGAPSKTEYTVDDAFDPAGLDVTGTYSDGSKATITNGISWNCTPTTFTEAGNNKTVSVTATVKSVTSAAYNVAVTVKARKLSPPANLKCEEKTETSLTFTWNAVDKASDYQVSTDDGKTYVSTQTNNRYTWEGLTAGTTKTLYVKAIGDGTNYTDSDAAPAEGKTKPAGVSETIDFEAASTTYTFWTFTNMTSQQNGSITAHGGTNYGTTGGKTTASITTKSKIASPQSITFYVSKESNNTASSSWKLQVSNDNSKWTDVKTQSATSMSKGSWVEVTQDLSSYSNVYVRVYYTGSIAVRNIDDLTFTYSE